MLYEVIYGGNTYSLDSEKCSFFVNDDDQPIEGVNLEVILKEMDHSDLVAFDKMYYDQACEGCHKNRKEGAKYFDFLECHFYLFAKDSQFIMSSLSADYEYNTLPDLMNKGIVDASYIVSINVCPICGDYTVEITYGLW